MVSCVFAIGMLACPSLGAACRKETATFYVPLGRADYAGNPDLPPSDDVARACSRIPIPERSVDAALRRVPTCIGDRESRLLPPDMTDRDPLTAVFTRLLVNKEEDKVSLSDAEQEQFDLDMQAALAKKLEQIREEQRTAFERANSITLK